MKTVRCPHCQKALIEFGRDTYNDERLNLRCKQCGNIVLATSEEDEKCLIDLYNRPVKDINEATSAIANDMYPHQTNIHQGLAGFPKNSTHGAGLHQRVNDHVVNSYGDIDPDDYHGF